MIAHIRNFDGRTEIQTVEEHDWNTGTLASGFGESFGMRILALLASLLHDIGKLSFAFGSYIHGDPQYARGSIDHCYAGAKYLFDLSVHDPSLADTAAFLGRVILSHHGLHDWIDSEGKDYFQRRIQKTEFYEEIMENARALSFFDDIPKLLREADAEYKILSAKLEALADEMNLPTTEERDEALAFYHGMLERLLTSILMDADRTDTADFMSGTVEGKSYDLESLWEEMRRRSDGKFAEFSLKTDPISKQRGKISERCAEFAKHPVGICRLVVPTGGGKTLSSLRFAIEYCQRFHKKKIIYVAPFMSIIEQNSDEIRSLSGDDAFFEHHSDALSRVMESGGQEQLNEYELRAERWDSPVIATTMVQFLNTLFSGKPSSIRRMHHLSDAVIIIDEIQSLPLKCTYLFNLAMNFLARICGSTIVLCSATQPPLEEVNRYPLLLDHAPDMIEDTGEIFAAFRRTEIINLTRKSYYTFEEVAEFCLEKQRENGSLLLIVNTKAAAAEIYKRLRGMDVAEAVHLSTNMCPQHRRETIDLVREKLRDHRPLICVTTQLIEAGVDISFGCVVRSLAGLDNIAQAAGRCNRNGEHDRLCPVFLLNLREENLGRLKEISCAQSVSYEILDTAVLDENFPDRETMSAFFRRLYRENRSELLYPYQGDTLVGLLSCNRERCLLSRKRPGLHGQAFATAGNAFEVIPNRTQSLLVPYYKNCKDKDTGIEQIVARLSSDCLPNRTSTLLRRLQPYMVEVYPEQLKILEDNGAVTLLPSGVLAVEENYYNKEYGLVAEAGESLSIL